MRPCEGHRARIGSDFNKFRHYSCFPEDIDIFVDAFILDGDEQDLHCSRTAAFGLDRLDHSITERALIKGKRNERFSLVSDDLRQPVRRCLRNFNRPDDRSLPRKCDCGPADLELVPRENFLQRGKNGLSRKRLDRIGSAFFDTNAVNFFYFWRIRLSADLDELDCTGAEIDRYFPELCHRGSAQQECSRQCLTTELSSLERLQWRGIQSRLL